MTTKQPPLESPPTCHFLNLPPELRLQIYIPLLTPTPTPKNTPLPISPLFIRAHYKTLFMSQHPKNICTSLLRVSRQITAETLPILYSLPFFRASCRLEQLASQIGVHNFSRIKRMEVDADDLASVYASLRRDVDERQGEAEVDPTPDARLTKRLRFANLERLDVEGWQKVSLTSRGTKAARVEGRGLCLLAIGILSTAPNLGVLVQVGGAAGTGLGGADARDMTMGRVKWRFLRGVGEMDVDGEGNEHVVGLVEMVALFDALIEMDEASCRGSESVSWRGGVFRQYPYLRTE